MNLNNPEEFVESLQEMPEEARYAFIMSNVLKMCDLLDVCPHCIAEQILIVVKENKSDMETKH